MTFFKIIVIIFLVVFIGNIRIEGLVAYDCSNTQTKITEISLVDSTSCQIVEKNITTKSVIIQLIQPQIFSEIEYLQCLVEIEHMLYRCGKTIDTFEHAGYYDELFDLDNNDCTMMINEGKFKYNGKTIFIDKKSNINFASLETIGSIKGGSCSPGPEIFKNGVVYDRPVQLSKFRFFMKKGKGSIDLEESKIITEDGSRCDYPQGNCLTSTNGYIFWDNIFHDSSCFGDKYLPIYEGPASEITEVVNEKIIKSIIIHYENYDFQVILTGKKVITCGFISYLTEHPKL